MQICQGKVTTIHLYQGAFVDIGGVHDGQVSFTLLVFHSINQIVTWKDSLFHFLAFNLLLPIHLLHFHVNFLGNN